MKKRSILLTAFTALFAFSASAFAVFGGVKADLPSNVTANTNSVEYWRNYFDIESDGDLIFTSEAKRPKYLDKLTTTALSGSGEIGAGDAPIGLGINFTDDFSMTYKTPININSFTATDALLEFYVNPATPTTNLDAISTTADREFNQITLELRGIENPEQYVKFYIAPSSDNPNKDNIVWGRVETNTMTAGGIKKGALDKTVTKGSPLNSSGFMGLGTKTMALALDYETMTAYGYNRSYPDVDGHVIRALQEPTHLSGTDQAFEGFDGNYVTVTATFGSLTNEDVPGNVIITKFCNQALNGKEFVDVDKPRLTFPTDIDKDDIPVGEVGTFYPFWDFTASDVFDGDITEKISYKVEYLGRFGTDSATSVTNVDMVNLGFTPSEPGFYNVITSVTDKAGNESNKITTKLEVLPIIDAIELTLDSTIPENVSVGETVTIPNYSVKGGSGTLKVDLTVSFNDRTEQFSTSSGSISIEKAGVYKITYVVSDYLGNEKVYDYPIYSALSDKPVISKTVVPEYWKKNNAITLNLPKAYDFNSIPGQKIEVPVKMYVAKQLAGQEVGSYSEVKPNEFGDYVVAKDFNLEKLYVKYTAKAHVGNNVKETEPNVITYVNPETLGDYFINVNGGIEANYETYIGGSNLENVFTVKENGATIRFLNPLLATQTKVRLNFEKETANFKKISIKLQDSENVNETVTFTLTRKQDNEVYLTTPHSKFSYVKGYINNLKADTGDVFFKFKLGKVIIDDSGSEVFTIRNYDNGDEFTKFSSNKVYVEIRFDEIDTIGGKVNKVRLSDFYTQARFFANEIAGSDDLFYGQDVSAPAIQQDTFINSYRNYQETITLPAAKAYDMFSPNCDVTLSVMAPDGTFVLGSLTTGVAANVEYSITLDQLGTYVIRYKALDERGNGKNPLPIMINTLDVIAPTVEIDGQIKSNYKVGDLLIVPEMIVEDNIATQEELNSYVFLQTPSFGFKTLYTNGTKGDYVFQQKGTYVLKFVAMDKDSNVTERSFTLTVTD